MHNAPPKLYDLINPADPDAVIGEVLHIAAEVGLKEDMARLEATHRVIVDLFEGRHPAYEASNTLYHDLEHTMSVVLAMARLLHGCSLLNKRCPGKLFILGICAAYFHDTGLILDKGDTQGTGAKHTQGHEQRSVHAMRTLLADHGYTEKDLEDMEAMIRCTELGLDPAEVPFRTPDAARVGTILGTADLLAQLADRCYLEKLPRLFKEFQEAGIPAFKSEMDLLRQTITFFEKVARRRIEGPLGNRADYMGHHFRARWNVDQDLYAKSIRRTLAHLDLSLDACGESLECLKLKFLKRNPETFCAQL